MVLKACYREAESKHQPWQLLAHAPMMSADDVQNQMARGYWSGVCRRHPVFVSIGIRKCIENLIDRELQLRTRLFERLVGLRAQVYVEAPQDSGCRWLRRNDFADGLC